MRTRVTWPNRMQLRARQVGIGEARLVKTGRLRQSIRLWWRRAGRAASVSVQPTKNALAISISHRVDLFLSLIAGTTASGHRANAQPMSPGVIKTVSYAKVPVREIAPEVRGRSIERISTHRVLALAARGSERICRWTVDHLHHLSLGPERGLEIWRRRLEPKDQRLVASNAVAMSGRQSAIKATRRAAFAAGLVGRPSSTHPFSPQSKTSFVGVERTQRVQLMLRPETKAIGAGPTSNGSARSRRKEMRALELTWRADQSPSQSRTRSFAPSPRSATATSTPLLLSPVPGSARGADERLGKPAMVAATASQQRPSAAFVSDLADEVMARIQRKLRVERERRGY